MENTKQLLPEQIGCIILSDVDKVNELISIALSVLDGNKCKEFDSLANGLPIIFPLTDIIEDAYKNGRNDKLLEDWCGDNMQQYLNQPITVKPKTCLKAGGAVCN